MCGIVGAITKTSNGFSVKAEQVFWELLYADQLRGDDATGVVFVENDTSFGIMKTAQPYAWCEGEFQQSAMGKAVYQRGKALIGHNRKKTIGDHTDKNAHPFVVNDVFAMVHNGTLRNHKSLANTDVDSEALAITLEPCLVMDDTNTLNKIALEEAIGKVDGAYAVAAYNQKSNQVFLTRNAERPLTYINTPDGFFWASEGAMLLWILSRNGIDLKDCNPVSLPPNQLAVFDLDTNKLEVIEYVPKKATPVLITAAKTGHIKLGYHNTSVSKTLPSKNTFKAIKKHWCGRELEFWVDDFVETSFPETVEEGAKSVHLFGTHDPFSFPHIVTGLFETAKLKNKVSSELDGLFRGTVVDMVFDRKANNVRIIVDDLTPTPIIPKLSHKGKLYEVESPVQ